MASESKAKTSDEEALAAAETGEVKSGSRPRRRTPLLGLSSKLLILTIVFVMIAEVLVFVPSVANFRKNWLVERLAAAQIAALAVAPGQELSQSAQDDLLKNAQVRGVALKRGGRRNLILQSEMPATIAGHYDLREASWMTLIWDALAVFFAPSNEYIRVVGQPGFGAGEFIEIVVAQNPLKAAMVRFGLSILGLSIIISVITAALVYLSLNLMLVRPMMRITRSMVRFSQNPEDLSRIIVPSDRKDEIGTAERELAHMQNELSGMLQQKTRLASLGLAVSKINHDLRNILSSAQLISDRLGGVQDPLVQRMAPKLVNSLDRAIRLCTDTLKFGRAQEAAPVRAVYPLKPLVEEVGESLGLSETNAFNWRIDMPASLEVDADHDQLFRVLSNLCRNALQAVETQYGGANPEIVVSANRTGAVVAIEVRDSGPGVPERARTHLFEPFQGSARKGGTGLGLAIAAELVQAHGGEIVLLEETVGTIFCITIPDRVVELHNSREIIRAEG
ncbi:MAG: HAMP domain-containing histidine kinase [Hyphomicrobiaceae bacterium]|nr:HAMP domain-containing histidine kinase [Hyphomicrobiaceae bacterium]